MANDPDSSVAAIAKVINQDVAMSARLIRVANSPLMRASRTIEDVQTAISRLGVSFTSNVVTSMAMEQMFQATNSIIDETMRKVWSASTEIAAMCYVLARQHAPKLTPDKATLAGLTYKIGVLPILQYLEDQHVDVQDDQFLHQTLESIHPTIGTVILKTWRFDDELISVPESYRQFTRDTGSNDPDYVDLVTAAAISTGDIDLEAEGIDPNTITAYQRLGVEPDCASMTIEDCSDDLAAAMAFFEE